VQGVTVEAAEHILLESDFRQVPDVRAARKVHGRVEFQSGLRRRALQLEIIDYYYLSVRSRSRTSALEYVLDLRFVDAPRVSRHVAWRWIAASLLLSGLAYEIVVRLGAAAPPWLQGRWLPICAAVAGAWAVALLVSVYRTTETIRLFTTEGGTMVLECTGGLGTLRAMRRFMAKVSAHIRLAAAARRSAKAEHLRDAMREHLRLKELGVLSEGEYETAKLRILKRHSPPVRSASRRTSAMS
jgi:hypothetical protein